MKTGRKFIAFGSFLLLSACGPVTAFPPEITRGVDTDFDFNAWRTQPKTTIGRTVQLGGRIVQVNEANDSLVLVVAHLPVFEGPTYGPRDSGKRAGEYAIFYSGLISSKALRPGNRLMVVGVTQQSQTVTVDEVQRNLPSLTARCVHIWNTGGKEIAEFPYNAGAGYEPLEENTYCLPDR